MRPPSAGADPAALRAWLLPTLQRLAPSFTRPIDETTPLTEHGLALDSLSVIELLSAIEERFGVTIREDEITEEHFGTVGRLLAFLTSRGAG